MAVTSSIVTLGLVSGLRQNLRYSEGTGAYGNGGREKTGKSVQDGSTGSKICIRGRWGADADTSFLVHCCTEYPISWRYGLNLPPVTELVKWIWDGNRRLTAAVTTVGSHLSTY